jgi:hypothetical protein
MDEKTRKDVWGKRKLKALHMFLTSIRFKYVAFEFPGRNLHIHHFFDIGKRIVADVVRVVRQSILHL